MNGPRYLLDTNIIIGFFAGKDWTVDFIEKALLDKANFFVSSITRMELLGFPGITEEEESKIESFLTQVSIVPLSEEIENLAISLRRTSRMKLPDAIISATSVSLKAKLVTADADFEKVEGIEVVNPSTQ